MEALLGKITSSGSSTTNASTATPFTIPESSRVYVQSDGAGYLQWGSTATTDGINLTAGQLFDTKSGRGPNATLYWISASGSTNLRVWAVRDA
jgi:hypothetical protein